MAPAATPASADRPCQWCTRPIRVVRRPGRPRLYCRRSCRQRAYERRAGLTLPAPAPPPVHPSAGRRPPGLVRLPGYERAVVSHVSGIEHALRPAGLVGPRPRRVTLCGLAADAAPGWFSRSERPACVTCCAVAAARPLAHAIRPSLELAGVRAQLAEIQVELTHLDRRGSPVDPGALRSMLGRVLASAA